MAAIVFVAAALVAAIAFVAAALVAAIVFVVAPLVGAIFNSTPFFSPIYIVDNIDN